MIRPIRHLSVPAVALIAVPAFAATPAPKLAMARGGGALPPILQAPQPSQPGRFSFSAGADFVSRYIARGEAYSNQPSFQPYVSLGIALPELQNDSVTRVKLVLGNWNSLQSSGPGLGQANFGTWKGWYESDLYGALTASFADGFSGSLAYYFFHSPAHSFDDYGDVELILRYDDTRLWKGIVPLRDFALKPQMRITRDIGRPGGANTTYFQPSLTPSFALGNEDDPVRIGIPLAFGFSDKYYAGVNGGTEDFGFFRTGLTVSTALYKTAHRSLRISGGVDVWFPNDNVANGLSSNPVVGRLGLSYSF